MGTEENSRPGAGWYDDPDGRANTRRDWDGSGWTDRYDPPLGSDAAQKRFASVRTIAGIFRVLGWAVAILGTLAVIAAGSEDSAQDVFGNSTDDTGANVPGILIGGRIAFFVYSLMLFAASAFIHLMLAVEDSTRRTAAAVERLRA